MAMDPEDRALLAATFADALATCRGADGDSVLAELGWPDLLDAEPDDAIAVVFGLLGRVNVRSSCLADVVGAAFGHPAGTPVAVPRYGSAEPPGHIDGGLAHVDGLALTVGDSLLVPCRGDRAAVVSSSELTVVAGDGMDRTLGLLRVSGSAPIAGPAAVGDWGAAVDLARVALAHELHGAAATMLALACDHALGRVQFGRRIASFQAVRHKLAEAKVAIEAAGDALAAAHDAPSSLTATLAKVLAGRAAQTASVHCQQVLAGIGFTREHELHRYLQRAVALDGLFGSTSSLTRDLGALVLSTGSAPKVIEL